MGVFLFLKLIQFKLYPNLKLTSIVKFSKSASSYNTHNHTNLTSFNSNYEWI